MSCFVGQLLPWFSEKARDLPWRRTRDPYAVWVSEIMLQQTQVKTVIPYWERWMRRLPTVRALAQCRVETVLKLWEGLGYYSRARNMHKAARMIAQQFKGDFPTTFGDVLSLPGVGRYTAGAICSIAFNQPTPILDGNTIRVLSRFFGVSGNPKSTKTNSQLWALAEEIVEVAANVKASGEAACSAINQALMELGATVCTAVNPQCDLCPIVERCYAKRTNGVHQLPALAPRAKTTQRTFVAVVAEHRGRVLVRQRPAGLVNGGLWEFPNMEVAEHNGSSAQMAGRIVGPTVKGAQPFCRIKHSITRYRITVEVFRCAMAKLPRNVAGKWLSLSDANKLAWPSAHRQILNRLLRPAEYSG